MKALVTGGAGFIGSHLVDRLMENGEEVVVFDNLSAGRIKNIEQYLNDRKFEFVKGDLKSLGSIRKVMGGIDMVFHFGTNTYLIRELDSFLQLEEGILTTLNVLEAMRVEEVKKIVFASSITIYEETNRPVAENYGPTLPVSLYGAGKVASEALISSFCNMFGMQAWIFRFANVIGERITKSVVFDFIRKLKKDPRRLEILGNGLQEKPYFYVKDCIEGVLYGLKYANEKVNLFNLGCESSTSVNRIAEIVVEEMGLEDVEFRYTGKKTTGDLTWVRYDCSKMKNLGWETKYDSDEAVRFVVRLLIKEEENEQD